MRTRKIVNAIALGVILGGLVSGSTQAQEAEVVGAPYNTYGGHDLFYNYYTQGYANQANAAMYQAPVPVPPNVGHTFYTYQPLYPHEMMHWHSHRYHNYYDNGLGLNRTKVHYYAPPVRTGANYVWRKIQLPRP